MSERGNRSGPDREVVDELEKFRSEIDLHRARRRAVSEEFEQFVRSLKSSQTPEGTGGHTTTATARTHVREIAVGSPPASPPRSTPPSRTAIPSRAPIDSVDGPLPAGGAGRDRRKILLGGIVTGLLLVALAVWAPGLNAPAPERDPSGDARPETPGEIRASAAAASPTHEAPRAAVTELRTTRKVWVRVIADGERLLERELPGDARIPLQFEKTLVIRAGDAGAVELTLAGTDQGPLGRTGAVLTRTFTMPVQQ